MSRKRIQGIKYSAEDSGYCTRIRMALSISYDQLIPLASPQRQSRSKPNWKASAIKNSFLLSENSPSMNLTSNPSFLTLGLVALVLVPSAVFAVDFTVNSVADTADAVLDGNCDDGTGKCTYRAAIEEANNLAGPDGILFAIPPGDCDAGTSVCTIAIQSALPDIDDPLSIDGSSQPGNSGVCTTSLPNRPTYRIVLDGGGLVSPGVRFHAKPGFVGASGSSVQGLNIRGFSEGVAIAGVNGTPIHDVTVACNFIGTDEEGLALAVPSNSLRGVIIVCDAHDHIVGGTSSSDGNLISGNNVGVWILCDEPGDGGTGNAILGNYIGTDKSGTEPLGNAQTGIGITGAGGPNLNVVGATADGLTLHGNVIGGHSVDGVWIEGAAVTNNSIVANFIGTNPSGTVPLPNGWDGIYLYAPGNTIGGPGPGEGNVIAFNGAYGGVSIFSDGSITATGNRIQQNSFYGNGDLGIDLGSDGATPNDPGDGDGGANLLQNYPVIQSVTENGGDLEIEYSVDSPLALTVEFFLADNFCQGQTYLGSDSYPGGNGLETAVVPNGGGTAQDLLVATATDSAGNTSEFSAPNLPCPYIFSNGFETGDTTVWSAAQL